MKKQNHVRTLVSMAFGILAFTTSCELTPSLTEQSKKQNPNELVTNHEAGKIGSASNFIISFVSLQFTSTNFAGIINVEIRDAAGTQILAAATKEYPVGLVGPNGWVTFTFSKSVPLDFGVKYRIYTSLKGNPLGTLNWAGLSNPGDWYAAGVSSAGSGDFNFTTHDISGMRDQACYAGEVGATVNPENYLWQEFIPGDARLTLGSVDLKLRVNLYGPENLFVDIRNSSGTVIGTSLPSTSGENGDKWVHFTFQNPIVLLKNNRYKIYARRTGWPSYFEPWNGVFLHYTEQDSYPFGNPVGGIDYAFKTDANGFPDQQQPNHNGFYPAPLQATQTGSPMQEFQAGAGF